jgi:hypothetical protein
MKAVSDCALEFYANTSLYLFLCLTGGGLFCWLPSIAIHFWQGQRFSGVDVIILTLAQPAVAAALALALRSLSRNDLLRSFAPLAICVGLWLLGPAATFFDATWSGGGFSKAGAWRSLLSLTAIFPASTFIGSTYDGSLFGVLLASATLAILFVRNLRVSKNNGSAA